MIPVRLLRLQSDSEAVRRLAHTHPKITVEGVAGNPPALYRLLLNVRSLRQSGQQLSVVESHRVEIRLPQQYPRDPPVCRMLTPVFHPNIAPHTICIGDHWTAGESLDYIIMRICEMLAFQSYNIKSPLNGEAAQWVENNLHELPTDREEFFIDLGTAAIAEGLGQECANCGIKLTGDSEFVCTVGHPLCGECIMLCKRCGAILCLVCESFSCTRCAEMPP